MKVEVAQDLNLVKAILIEPSIWERFSNGVVEPENFFPVVDAFSIWLVCYEENEPVGVILVHNDNSVTLKIHPYLRQEHRQKGRVMMKVFYEWFLVNVDEKVNKINVTIPETQKKVINFAKKVGFKKEGLNRESFRYNGQLYDQQNLGITRNEIKEYLR